MFKVLSSVRTFSSSPALYKSADLIKSAFVKKIREYALKSSSGKLLNAAEVESMLDDELNRLANKFHMENAAAVRELPRNFVVPEVESAVQKILEDRNLDDMIAQVEREIADYVAQRKARKVEEARRAELLMSGSDTPEPLKPVKAA